MIKIYFTACTILMCSLAYGQDQSEKGADKFIGTWHSLNSADTIVISKDGDNYVLDGQGKKLALNYQDDVLKTTDPSAGKVIYNAFNGHVFWQKKEFDYVEQVANDGNVNSTTPNITNYAPGTVGDYMNDKLSTQESFLFHVTGNYKNPKEKVYLDFNFHEVNNTIQYVAANAVLNGILNANRFKRVAYDKYVQHANEPITCIISYSDIDVHTEYIGRVDMYGNQLPDYDATTSCKVSVTDANGNVLYAKTFHQGRNTMGKLVHLRIPNEEDAIKQSVKKLSDEITDFFNEKFPVITTVTSVNETGNNGGAKMILLKGGEKMGMTEGNTFRIMYNDKQIGEVKVKEVGEQKTLCKVLDGGDAIATKLNDGKTLEAISE